MGTTPGRCNCVSDSEVVFYSLMFHLGSVMQQISLCKLQQVKLCWSSAVNSLIWFFCYGWVEPGFYMSVRSTYVKAILPLVCLLWSSLLWECRFVPCCVGLTEASDNSVLEQLCSLLAVICDWFFRYAICSLLTVWPGSCTLPPVSCSYTVSS